MVIINGNILEISLYVNEINNSCLILNFVIFIN